MKKFLASTIACLSSISCVFGVDVVNGGGFWSDPSTWSNGEVLPEGSDFVTAGYGTLILDKDYSAGKITGNYSTTNFTFEGYPDTTFTFKYLGTSFECPEKAVDYSIAFDCNVNFTGELLDVNTSVGGNSTGSKDAKYTIKFLGETAFSGNSISFRTYDLAYNNVHSDGEIGRNADFRIAILNKATTAGNLSMSSKTVTETIPDPTPEDPDRTKDVWTTILIPLTLEIGSKDNSAATMEVNGGVYLATSCNLDVYGTLNATGKLSANSNANSTVNIYNGGTIQINQNIADTTTYLASEAYNMNISGTFKYHTASTQVNQDFLNVAAGGKIVVNAGGQIVVEAVNSAAECHIVIKENATLEYAEGSLENVNVRRIKFSGDGATLTLNQSGVAEKASPTFIANNVSYNINIGADSTVLDFHFWDVALGENSVDVNINFKNGSILTLGSIVGGGGSNYYDKNINFILTDFFDNGVTSSIKFTDSTFVKDASSMADAVLWIAKSFSSNGWEDFYVDTDGWLRATQVIPEPSVFAVLFGIFALGYAIRRRK